MTDRISDERSETSSSASTTTTKTSKEGGSTGSGGSYTSDYVLQGMDSELGGRMGGQRHPNLHNNNKQVGSSRGHKFFLLCDVRRAAIIVNLFSVFLGIVSVGGIIFIKRISHVMGENFDDDQIQDAVQFFQTLPEMGMPFAVLLLLEILFAGVGLIGAYTYNRFCVGLTLAYYSFVWMTAIVNLHFFAFVWFGVALYPHVFLLWYIVSGIMSKETYQFERMSICCI